MSNKTCKILVEIAEYITLMITALIIILSFCYVIAILVVNFTAFVMYTAIILVIPSVIVTVVNAIKPICGENK